MNPLEDIDVLELTQMLAGSFAGQTLAEYGANIVKVERPEYGEIARHVEPMVGGESFYYMGTNRGKKSITLDLKTDEGQAVFLDLAEEVDVIIENFAPGTVDRLGVGYDAVQERNPEIIYCSISAFGQTGPNAERAGVDYILQAYGGITSMTRDLDGRPMRCGLTVADLAGASYASNAILASIRRRDKVGRGDYLDVALSDALLSFLSIRACYSFASGEPFPPIGRSHVYFVPEGIFATADGYIQVSIVTETHWERLCGALKMETLQDDPKFATVGNRRENRDELLDILDEQFSRRTTEEWVDRLVEQGVPAQQIHDTLSVWEDPHTKTREMEFDVKTPSGEDFTTVAYPVKHHSWDWNGDDYIAEIGADTETVLRRLGYSEETLQQLEKTGII